ncbi:hypothetical protein [Microbispora hainanensis]|uniref:hypothetical protein n=1 Tax=Microbispora hainanensis TaxID=568844 RepID=UPI003245BDCD
MDDAEYFVNLSANEELQIRSPVNVCDVKHILQFGEGGKNGFHLFLGIARRELEIGVLSDPPDGRVHDRGV